MSDEFPELGNLVHLLEQQMTPLACIFKHGRHLFYQGRPELRQVTTRCRGIVPGLDNLPVNILFGRCQHFKAEITVIKGLELHPVRIICLRVDMPDERFSRQLRSDKGILSPDKEQIMFIEQMIEIGLGDERERSDARLVMTGVF